MIYFHCKIFYDNKFGNEILLDKTFKTLKELSDEIEVPYQFVADISSRKTPKKFQRYCFNPKIEITRITNNNTNNINKLKDDATN